MLMQSHLQTPGGKKKKKSVKLRV
jgi:hypothetical protein